MLKVPAQWEIPPQRYAFRAGPQTLPGFQRWNYGETPAGWPSRKTFQCFQNLEVFYYEQRKALVMPPARASAFRRELTVAA